MPYRILSRLYTYIIITSLYYITHRLIKL